MSIINQMLKDLDKREQSLTVRAVPTAVAAATAQSLTSSKRLHLVLLAVLVLIIMGSWLWLEHAPVVTAAPELVVSVPSKAEASLSTKSVSFAKNNAAEEATQVASVPITTDETSEVSELVTAIEHSPKVQLKTESPPQLQVQQSYEPKSQPESESLLPRPQQSQPQQNKAMAPTGMTLAVDESISQTSNMAVTEVSISPTALAERTIIQARKEEDAGRFAQAAELYVEVLFLKNDSHEARRRLAALKYGQGETNEAIRLLEVGQLNYPGEASFALLLAKLWLERGDVVKAQANLERIGPDSEYQHDKWLLLADIARITQNHVLAEQSYTRLLAGRDDKSSWWLGLAYSQDAQGKFNDAAGSYRRALAGSGLSEDARQFAKDRLLQLRGNR